MEFSAKTVPSPQETSKINSKIRRPTVNTAVEIFPKIVIFVAVIYLASSFCSR